MPYVSESEYAELQKKLRDLEQQLEHMTTSRNTWQEKAQKAYSENRRYRRMNHMNNMNHNEHRTIADMLQAEDDQQYHRR